MDTQAALLIALLGAVVGGGLALVVRPPGSGRVDPVAHDEAVRTGMVGVLDMLRSSPLLLDREDVVVQAPASAYSQGLVRNRRIASPEIVALVHQVRADGEVRETEVELPGAGQPAPSGQSARVVSARIGRLEGGQVLVLAEDRTQERRIEAVRRDFVANVSHELKTPVGAIRLLSEAVREAADDPEAVQRFAGRMHHESDRLSALVQQIIELSRLQGDDPLATPDEVDVDRVLATAVDDNAIDALAKRIDVLHGGDAELRVLGSDDQISLAVANLVSNAITYSPAGSRVAVAARARDDRVEISVTDQGIGIPSGELDRIFERFYRVDPARHRSTGGTGLGLSIVKHVVASHGGEVRVWSAEGEGSTFTLSLPRSEQEAS